MSFISRNPATGDVLETFEELTPEQCQQKLEQGQRAFESWRLTSFEERAERMQRLAGILRERKRELGEHVSREMGKPITAAMGEVEKCGWACEFYAEHAQSFLADEVVATDASKSYVRHDPLGIILAVMPWNFPFWQVMRFAAPALMAGNVGVLKHASNVPRCAVELERVFVDAGFPEGVFQTFLISSRNVESLIKDDRVKAIALTGSEAAGSQVAAAAGREIKKTVLELGGSDPFLVFPDADMTSCIAGAIQGRLQNAGQSCIAAKRFIVIQDIADTFISAFANAMQAVVVGDPLNETTTMGPLATELMCKELEEQVAKSIEKGARLVCGGKRRGDVGFFYEPTILADIKPGMPAYDEELFGPVASVIIAKDVDDAIRIANDTRFGLGSSVWTNNPDIIERCAREIQAGSVFVNGIVKSDPRLPFGGINKSGYGRELSRDGIREFVNIKTVWIR